MCNLRKRFYLMLALLAGLFLLTTGALAAQEGAFIYQRDSEGNVKITGYTETAARLDIPSEIQGDPVTVIGAGAFSDQTGLTDLTIPDSVTRIESEAFSGCINLKRVTLPAGIPINGENFDAFMDCTSITYVKLTGTGMMADYSSSSFTPWGRGNFAGEKVTVELSEGVTGISSWAFEGCRNLGALSLPSTLTEIEPSAFYDCDGLTSVTIPAGVTSIGYGVFSNCSKLTSVTLPAGVTSIGMHAFNNCTALAEINFGGTQAQWDNVAINQIGNEALAAAKINVKPPVAITRQPVDVTAPLKSKAIFTVAAEGENLAYQWEVRSGPTKNWNEALGTGNQTPSMSISVTAKKDGYQYRCAVTGGGTTVYSDIATLIVGTPAPAFNITRQPVSVTTPIKSKAVFTVAADGEELTYQWQVRSGPTKNWNEALGTGNQTPSMSMSATAKKDGYQYRCAITDSNGNTVHSEIATLTIGTPAPAFAITQQPMDVTAPVKSKIFFTVAANGENLTYQWEVRSGPTKNWNEALGTGNQTPSMSISVTAKKNGYQYRCAVTDGSGNTVHSNIATLTVN